MIDKTTTVYQTVEMYESKIFSRIKPERIKIFSERTPVRSLINIHNEDGIKNIPQIKIFISMIKNGRNIIKPNGLPNIKLARLRQNEFLVFDGHHSLLAYMAAGKLFIDEIPHIVVSGKGGVLKNAEVLVFWGHHAPVIPENKWKRFVINWQNPKKTQITIRTRRNMGELFDVLKEKILN